VLRGGGGNGAHGDGGTAAVIKVQNQQGWSGSTDNTGGSLISRVGSVAPELDDVAGLDVFGDDASVEVGTDPGSRWGLVSAIAGTIEFGAGTTGVRGGIQDYSFQCRMDVPGGKDGENVLPCAHVTTTPEPISMVLLGTGLAGLAFVRRRRPRGRDEVAMEDGEK
jgi:hypothetical protein